MKYPILIASFNSFALPEAGNFNIIAYEMFVKTFLKHKTLGVYQSYEIPNRTYQ